MKLLRQEDGSAMIEFATFISVLTMILLAAVDYTLLIIREMELQESAMLAAQYGAIPGNESNLSGVQSVALQSAYNVPGVVATATNVWSCTPGGTSVPSTTACSGGTPYKYLVVKTSASVPRLVVYSGLASNTSLQGSATIRVPWSR